MTYHDHIFGQGAAKAAPVAATEWQKLAINPLAAHDPAKSKAAPGIEPTEGTWFDPLLDFRDPEGHALTTAVLSLIAAIEPRPRKPKQADAQNRYARIRAILANGFRCHFHRRPHRVAFHRHNTGYKNYVGRPSWLNQGSMPTTIELLSAARLIMTCQGKNGQASSTYHIMPKLYGIAQDCGVTQHSLILSLPLDRLVRLREGNSKTPYLPFEPTDDTRRWTEQLQACNAFIRQQDIALALTEEEQAEWVKDWNNERRATRGKDCPVLIRPELFQTDLYRQFNHGSFDQGGRLYGGWWINAPKRLRPRITINSQPTVELDYSGYHIRMLYHQRGIDYRGAPYELDELTACKEENGLPIDYFKGGMKSLFNALLNGNPGGQPQQARIKDFSFKPYFTRPQLRRMIEEKHAPIADAFGTGAGLRLQRLDSDIALSIITRLREQGIAALPIHDSFIVTEDEGGKLRRMMEEEYKSIFFHQPIIRKVIMKT